MHPVNTEDIEQSVALYSSLGLTKAWEAFQDEERKWRLVGMRFPEGETELVLKDNSEFKFAETEIMVEDVRELYESLRSNSNVRWIREPFPNALGGHVAVMQAPDGNAFVLVGG